MKKKRSHKRNNKQQDRLVRKIPMSDGGMNYEFELCDESADMLDSIGGKFGKSRDETASVLLKAYGAKIRAEREGKSKSEIMRAYLKVINEHGMLDGKMKDIWKEVK